MTDWLSALQQFKDANPDLPTGAETEVRPTTPDAPKKEKLQIVFERKGRAGKPATIICGFADSTSDADIESLAREIKQRLGTGGSARGGEILIQGDRRTAVSEFLKAKGYKTNI